ncbi:MAG: co-chaperone GroES [Planctomycetota bacterium]
MAIRPLDDRILLEVIDPEATTPGGIVLPDSARESSQRGKVKAVGEGKLLKDGKRSPPDVKKGDVVLFGKYSGADVQVEGVDYKILRESEVLGKVGGA